MKIKGLLRDRQKLISSLEELTGERRSYSGAPRFQYQIGKYTILRDGSLVVSKDEAEWQVLSRLAEMGLIEMEQPQEESLAPSFPINDISGQTAVNIINTIAARETLLNKAIGRDSFHVSPTLTRKIKEDRPNSIYELMETIYECGGGQAVKGLRITPDQLTFTGFHSDGPEAEVYAVLAERIVATAQSRRWIKPTAVKGENEKYSFRVWLNAIGMQGQDYAEARAFLLKDLTGDGSFRTKEQQDAFYKSRRRNLAEKAIEPDFIVL